MEKLQQLVYSQIIQLRKKRGLSKQESERFFTDKYSLTLTSVATDNNLDNETFMKDIKGHPYSLESVLESIRLVYELTDFEVSLL